MVGRRLWMTMWIVVILLLPTVLVVAQDEMPTEPPTEAPAEEATLEELDPEPQQIDPTLDILLPARLDLELLATAILGGARPEGWTGVQNINDPGLATLTRLDLELLAANILDVNTRPDGWFGVVASSPYAIARDIRHDLELLVDAAGVARPVNWAGAEPLLRCDRATQALVQLLEEQGIFTLTADRTSPDFCVQAAQEAAVFVEVNLLASGGDVPTPISGGAAGAPQTTEATTGYFDIGGTIPAGTVPGNEPLEIVARGSDNLILVRGFAFELFIDAGATNLSADEIAALPGAGAIRVAPRCDASWCG